MPPPVLLAVNAMATRFELVLHGDDAARLRAAGEEALAEITRVEQLLSAYTADSDIARINRDGAAQPVRVTAETCRVLRQCLGLSRATSGAFDVTVGPLVRLWRNAGDTGRRPDDDALRAAQALVGANHVIVDEDTLSVALARSGVAIDLGAAGKGYAVDLAVDILREHGVTSALLHGGTSSVHVIGHPPGDEAWRVRWEGPGGVIALRDAALAVSAPHGRVVEADGVAYGHVIDPATGEPVRHSRAAGVTGPQSLTCDACSTALLVRGESWLPDFRQRWPAYDGWVARQGADSLRPVVQNSEL